MASVVPGLTSLSRGTGFLPQMLPATPGRMCFWERQSHRVGLYFQSKAGKHAEGKRNIVYDLFAHHFPGVSSFHTALRCRLGAEALTSTAPNSRSAEVRGAGPVDHGLFGEGRGGLMRERCLEAPKVTVTGVQWPTGYG